MVALRWRFCRHRTSACNKRPPFCIPACAASSALQHCCHAALTPMVHSQTTAKDQGRPVSPLSAHKADIALTPGTPDPVSGRPLSLLLGSSPATSTTSSPGSGDLTQQLQDVDLLQTDSYTKPCVSSTSNATFSCSESPTEEQPSAPVQRSLNIVVLVSCLLGDCRLLRGRCRMQQTQFVAQAVRWLPAKPQQMHPAANATNMSPAPHPVTLLRPLPRPLAGVCRRAAPGAMCSQRLPWDYSWQQRGMWCGWLQTAPSRRLWRSIGWSTSHWGVMPRR